MRSLLKPVTLTAMPLPIHIPDKQHEQYCSYDSKPDRISSDLRKIAMDISFRTDFNTFLAHKAIPTGNQRTLFWQFCG